MNTQLYFIAAVGNGQLSVMPKPSTENLTTDIEFYHAKGVSKVVSLLLPQEIEKFSLQTEAQTCEQFGIDFTHFPVQDMNVPEPEKLKTLIQQLNEDLQNGAHLAIHCHGGRGRAGTLALCLMIEHGYQAEQAMQLAQAARGDKMPVNELQTEFVINYRKTA
ncbi:protein-tyrosine phosphatase family protein [Thiomicrorhabdus sediminis]|uniref:Tyrosine specific protein phosphatases domain-containing protein n=1 Tax=Thiomicrorhabdus sediminis TaxID=2580412 RepID=A0A4P9K6W0_9GAMM|nr:protein-tyrosine phosphatase family protein [Thiomicrorhabdus sediminis]QCU90066.1 hypothetical protein FE785_05165 [Thiomicrorhabdus sediminis]